MSVTPEESQDPFEEDSQGPTPKTVEPASDVKLPDISIPTSRSLSEADPVISPKTSKKKVFTRANITRSVKVSLCFPKLYPDYEPWTFEFRLKLSQEAEERRQQYLSLAASLMTVKLHEQALDEVCDLLVSLPTGFGDLQDTGQGPGQSFRSYVETSTAEMKDQLLLICEGADNLYWQSISPREFRESI